ncbi:MAG: hypothetical protein IJ403_01655 [Oscillospiraceae bacterium]|nr:hypothetical protein [Oscillospiraceae bacterium]
MVNEKRLIDANALKELVMKEIHHYWNYGEGGYYLAEDVVPDIDNAPTVDAVEVVRCKDCKHCDFFYPAKELDKEAIPAWYCKKQRGDRKPDDFCSYGERRI